LDKVKVVTHDGKEYEAEIENYDPVEMNTLLNDQSVSTVLIGKNIHARINIKDIIFLEE
jgi:small nuclear ribonucleoprotein (snRNP)-like protein